MTASDIMILFQLFVTWINKAESSKKQKFWLVNVVDSTPFLLQDSKA